MGVTRRPERISSRRGYAGSTPADAQTICADLEQAHGAGVAIIDLNDFGGTIAVSPSSLPAPTLATVLADNPVRQRCTGTPIAIIRWT